MVFDWLILRVPGWNRRVRKIRRDWDRAREETLKKKGELRKILLKKLDLIEENIKLIEEQPLSRLNKRKIARGIEIDMEEIKTILEAKKDELSEQFSKTRGNNKKQSTFI
ncbi:MAG: hypothetical protein KKB03_02130 [Nanoarchaeota archaeon]|nr:hypothetical protein [Nanoarchaeota archaeon]MBU1135653.1 hypothetical protein [Nanoarchaeota archaeon]MBU2520018.1 hypothetical protein [Nanoarchaeota archaeon]